MAVRRYHLTDQAPLGEAGPTYYVCDTDAEKPTSGMNEGDLVYTKDLDKRYFATSNATLSEITGGGVPSVSLLYANTSVPAGNTVANTTAETNFASNVTLGANTLAVGNLLRVNALGIYGTDALAGGTLTLRVKFGSTVLLTSGALSVVLNLANRGWMVNGFLTVISTGATGTVEAQGVSSMSTAVNLATVGDMENTGPVTIDTTVANVLQLSAQISVADAENTITLRQMTVEKLAVA